jgi:hypothetical protein
MTKLTEDEAIRLLRETFADKESLVDRLPEATARKTIGVWLPILAAACVLALLGGVAFAVGVIDRPGANGSVPAAGASPTHTGAPQGAASASAEMWAEMVAKASEIDRPKAGWPSLSVLDAPHDLSLGSTGPGRGKPFDPATKRAIEQRLAKIAPIHWVSRWTPEEPTKCSANGYRSPIITISPLTLKNGHHEATFSIWLACGSAQWVTLAIERDSNGRWNTRTIAQAIT